MCVRLWSCYCGTALVLYLLSVFFTSNMSCIGIAFDVNASCIVSDDFNDFRWFLIFSDSSVFNADVYVNPGGYLNSKFYDHDFQSKPGSNSKNFKPEILFSVFSLMFFYIFFETQSWIKDKNIWICYINFSAQCYEILQPFRGLWQYKNL